MVDGIGIYLSPPLFNLKVMVCKMERNYKKKYEFQKDIISRQQKQIEDLKSEIAELKSKCKEKDELIRSIEPLKVELNSQIEDLTLKKDEYDALITELREMKKNMNEIVFNKKWKLIRFLMK